MDQKIQRKCKLDDVAMDFCFWLQGAYGHHGFQISIGSIRFWYMVFFIFLQKGCFLFVWNGDLYGSGRQALVHFGYGQCLASLLGNVGACMLDVFY